MNKTDLSRIKNHADTFRHSSFQYIEFDDVADYTSIAENDDLILLQGYSDEALCWQYHWAADSPDKLIPLLPSDRAFILTFIPKEWVPELKQAGLEIRSIWHDYFRSDLDDISDNPALELTFLSVDDAEEASEVTLQCRAQSRGFTGQTPEWLRQWLTGNDLVSNAAILGYRLPDGELAGVLCTGTYGHDAEKGAVVWIKEVAVKPAHQGKGIGRKLITQALQYGKRHGGRKAFLAVDEENLGAIHLYESMGFVASAEEGEINMMRGKRLCLSESTSTPH